jgi:hypothetical protein
MVAWCWAMGWKMPDEAASTWRTATSTTGVETGRLPLSASAWPPRSSANRKAVTNWAAAMPPLAANQRRVATPTALECTSTVTGASGSPCCSRSTASRSARRAGGP